jgi:hypothetical protein
MRRSPTGRLAFVAMLTVGLVAAGCGSSGSSGSTSTTALTKTEWLKKANAICKKGNQQINAGAQKVFPKSKGKPSPAELNKFATGTLIPSVQSQIDQINALGAPKGDEAKVTAILNSAQAALDKGKKDPALLTTNGPGPFKKTNQLSTAYGLTTCGSG